MQHFERRDLAELVELLHIVRRGRVEALLDPGEPLDSVVECEHDVNVAPVDDDPLRALGDFGRAVARMTGAKSLSLLYQSRDADLGEQSFALP